MSKRNAHGSGSIRYRSDGRWEARFTYRDDLGQTRRGSVYGATQKECRQQLTAALARADRGSYRKGQRHTVAQWIDEWLDTFCADLKPRTQTSYRHIADRYIIPNIGRIQLTALTPTQLQRFINKLGHGYKGQVPLSPKTIANVHGVLHSALAWAVTSGALVSNPADNLRLPKREPPKLTPLMDNDVTAFLDAIQGDRFESLFIFALFSGMRQSEILGLEWPDIDFAAGEVTVCRQLQRTEGGGYAFVNSPKNHKPRTVPLAPSIVGLLRDQQRRQAEWQLAAGAAWSNPDDLVFTDELGAHLKHHTVYNHFKKVAADIGCPDARFHDLRHSCAVLALESGASVKSVSEQLGHYSTSFTMDVYASVSGRMEQDLQERMEQVIKRVSNR